MKNFIWSCTINVQLSPFIANSFRFICTVLLIGFKQVKCYVWVKSSPQITGEEMGHMKLSILKETFGNPLDSPNLGTFQSASFVPAARPWNLLNISCLNEDSGDGWTKGAPYLGIKWSGGGGGVWDKPTPPVQTPQCPIWHAKKWKSHLWIKSHSSDLVQSNAVLISFWGTSVTYMWRLFKTR